MSTPSRPYSLAAERNRQPILDVLRQVLPPAGTALEIASGTGQHAAYFATHLPQWTWLPSDSDPASLATLRATIAEAQLPNLRDALSLDVTADPWPGVPAVEAIFCANMLHASPWETCRGLMRGAARHLAARGRLVTYGPYVVDGEVTAPSNLAFDADLRARDSRWGLRRLADVEAEAAAVALTLRQRIAMPANNFMLVFERTAGRA